MKNATLTRMFSTAAVLGALAAPATAQEEGITLPGASAEVTVDYVTNYFFRGYEQQVSDEGITIQPGASLTIPVVDDITATVGTWGSIQSETSTSNQRHSWYEQDVYGSLDATFGDFSASIGMTLYTYPSATSTAVGQRSSVIEAFASLGFDDSEYLGDFAFSPYVMVATEINDSNVNLATGQEATYLEVGGAFSLDSLTEGTFAEVWTWEVPITVGLSLDDYYNDASGAEEFFGYASIGLAGSVPLSEYLGTDEWVGAWDLTLGLTAVFANGDIDAQLTDNGGRELQVIGQVGIAREW